MRPTFFICTVIGIMLGLNSCQTNLSETIEQPGFDGIYEFKLGKTTVSALDTLPFQFREMSVKEDMEKTLEMLDASMVTDWEYLCVGVRLYEVEDFQKNGMKFSHAELTFFNDTLSEITCSTPREFLDVLKIKYPNYSIDDTSHSYCKEYNWSNNPILASYMMYHNYSGSCLFTIYDASRERSRRNVGEILKLRYEHLNKMGSDL
jgi:hypothetical protein